MPAMSLINHVSVGTNQFDAAVQFYDAVMAALGAKRVMEFPGAVAYGRELPEFWVQRPYDGKDAGTANGVHFGFNAASKAEVDAFHAAALAKGGTDDGKPGPRVDYGAQYYGAFVRDPAGNKIEAMFWDTSAA
jgi:catechol 2,3-dioxygenase-like lactoylglutathione lyase family enzyme